MKNALALLSTVLIFSLSSFTKTGTLSNHILGAIVINNNYQEDYTGRTTFNECTGEELTFSGMVHIQDQIIINNNKETYRSHSNAHGLKAISPSGMVYNVVGVDGNEIENIHYNNGAVEYTSISRFQYVGRGPGNNVSFTFKYHVTVNANGETTSEFEESDVHCQ